MWEHFSGSAFSYMTLKMWFSGIIFPFLAAMVTTFFIHPLVWKMAIKKNMTDAPDYRKLQKYPIPVMGGLAVFFGIITGAGVTSIFFDTYTLFTCIVAMTVMMYIGMLDDMVGLSPKMRLIIEILVIIFIVMMDKTNINDFHGLFGIGKLPVYISAPLCIISCTGIINAVNMIDGVNGLSSGLCVFACLCFGIVFCASYSGTMSIMAALGAGALIPFFIHNVFGKKSKMFIGDSGTMMMGVLMCIFCLRMIDNDSLVANNHPRLGVIAFCLSVLSIPVFDTLRVMTGRIMRHTSPFHADKSHLHHLFIEMGFSHLGTTVCVISLDAFNVLCWFITYCLGGDATIQFIVVVIIGLINTTGFHYSIRRMNHNRLIYRGLKRLAALSQIEDRPAFQRLRNFVDHM
jgi:UDP-N-acetylmuramyl pentapeptide phosphotransferase/UDP-N-acetylglucosamine-1-phosphate transferase